MYDQKRPVETPTYLIFVTTVTTGGSVLLSSRRTFFHKKYNTQNTISTIPDTKNVRNIASQCQSHQLHQQKTKYANQKPSTPTKYRVRQPKYQVRQQKYELRQQKIYAVLSRGNLCRGFMHFFGVLFAGLKIWWRTKNDKYEV